MHHYTNFHQNRSKGCRDIAFNVFQYGGRLPFWNLMVFINVQHLVTIALVVLIIQKFEYFARLA